MVQELETVTLKSESARSAQSVAGRKVSRRGWQLAAAALGDRLALRCLAEAKEERIGASLAAMP